MIDPEGYDVVLLIAGLAALGAATLPRLLEGRLVSFPLAYLLIGVAVFALPLGIALPDPREEAALFERLSELTVIIALMGAGLKLDRDIGWRSWGTTWRLLAITMPLTIAVVYGLGVWVIGLTAPLAMLVAASLAPTDPVLAADVQVRGIYQRHEDELRFGLTSEAGLNDALAFPFVNAAILMAMQGADPRGWFAGWLAVDVGYKLAVGLVVGLAAGRILGDVIFGFAEHDRLADLSGFVALAATLLTYGATEILGGYGFLAVFVAASMLRHHAGSHAYHEVLHHFTEEAERLLVAGLLILFGGALDAGILGALSREAVVAGVLIVFVVRPAAGLLGLVRSPVPRRHRLGIAFFGIRGMGSIYYFAHGLVVASFVDSELGWALLSWVILLSIVLHGLTSNPMVRWVEDEADRP